MKRFVLKCSLFIIPLILIYGLAYETGYYPIISNSISFDSKIFEIKRRNLKQLNIIALGSSVALDNLNGQVIRDSLNCSFYNFGVWGMEIRDINHLIKGYVSIYKPKYVLLVSCFGDFEFDSNNELPNNLWLTLNVTPFYYIKNYVNYKDIIFRKNEISHDLAVHNDFNYLGLDKYGGISINISDSIMKKIIAQRLKPINYLRDNFPNKYTIGNYKSLDSLAFFLKSNKIKLIFIQSPFADNYIKTKQKSESVMAHFKTCKAIVEKEGGIYLNFEQPSKYPDSLFADPLHLTGKGSVFFTKRVASKLKTIIK